jgi:hypothetical protein
MDTHRLLLPIVALGLLGGTAGAGSVASRPAFESADVPKLWITNGVIRALVLLPDAKTGYYRGSRFDWSGLVARVEFQGHTYFGEWKTPHDPQGNDDVVGTAEEFGTTYPGTSGPLGYAEAKPGADFLKIGVGLLKKVEEPEYRFWFDYQITKPGPWTVRHGPNWVEFRQDLSGGDGWGYSYTKRITLPEKRPELVITRSLRNTGSKPLATSHYCHDFTIIDGEPIGPGYRVQFPFAVTTKSDLEQRAELRGNTITFPSALKEDQSVFAELAGFSAAASDHAATIENLKSGAGVRIEGDRPLARFHFWATRRAACPEPFVQIELAPGEQAEWQTGYTFFARKGSG